MSYRTTWKNDLGTIRRASITTTVALMDAQRFLQGEVYTPEDSDSDDEKMDAWDAFIKVALLLDGSEPIWEVATHLEELLKEGTVEFPCDGGTLTIEEVTP